MGQPKIFPNPPSSKQASNERKFDLLGTPPALLSEKFYLTNSLSAAEITDMASQAGLLDVSAKLNSLVAEAAGREVYLPQGGRVRCDTTISYTTASSSPFVPGLKLFGSGWDGTLIDSRVSNGAAFAVDTTTGFKFQRGIILDGLQITGEHGTPTTCDAFQLRRAYDLFIGDVYFNNLRRGIYNKVLINDQDSSNNFEISRQARFNNCRKWAFEHEPIAGQNDTSGLIFEASVVGCGTKEWIDITAVTRGATTTIECIGHDFAVAEHIIILGITGGPVELNLTDVVLTAITATTITFATNSSGYAAWTAGGIVMRAEPNSGAIKWKGQMGQFRGNGITETQNVGLLIPYAGGGPSYKTDLNDFTIENVVGVSAIVNGCDGFTSRNADTRSNQTSVGVNYAHYLFNATQGVIKGVAVENPTLIHFNGTNPWHRGFAAIGALESIKIENPLLKEYDTTVATRQVFDSNIFGGQAIKLELSGADIFKSTAIERQTYTAVSPTYTMDVRRYEKALLLLSTGTSGTLTIAAFNDALASSANLNGREVIITIINNTAGTINIAYGESTIGAPTTIAAGVTKVGRWTYDASVNWYQSVAWL